MDLEGSHGVQAHIPSPTMNFRRPSLLVWVGRLSSTYSESRRIILGSVMLERTDRSDLVFGSGPEGLSVRLLAVRPPTETSQESVCNPLA